MLQINLFINLTFCLNPSFSGSYSLTNPFSVVKEIKGMRLNPSFSGSYSLTNNPKLIKGILGES